MTRIDSETLLICPLNISKIYFDRGRGNDVRMCPFQLLKYLIFN